MRHFLAAILPLKLVMDYANRAHKGPMPALAPLIRRATAMRDHGLGHGQHLGNHRTIARRWLWDSGAAFLGHKNELNRNFIR